MSEYSSQDKIIISILGLTGLAQEYYVGDGWRPLVNNTLLEMRKAGWCGELLQVKQKFGELRIYFSEPDNEVREVLNNIVMLACLKSLKTCETCGQPGEQIGNYGDTVSCIACDDTGC